jgi:hypothetical protein
MQGELNAKNAKTAKVRKRGRCYERAPGTRKRKEKTGLAGVPGGDSLGWERALYVVRLSYFCCGTSKWGKAEG